MGVGFALTPARSSFNPLTLEVLYEFKRSR
jgi:hypothetical protein